MNGDIMTVSRLRMGTDGKGVTTLVTFFNCPLNCKYCINDFCHGSGTRFDRTPRYSYSARELLKTLGKDEIYYLMSGGGVTFGGGEPLLQSDFIHEVCQLANPDWTMRIETSLNVPWKNVEPIIEDIDEWIIDIKDMNPDIYQKYTGASIEMMYNNLCKLREYVDTCKLHIRIPRIPGYNKEEDIEASVKQVKELIGVEPEVFDYTQTLDIRSKNDTESEIYDIEEDHF